MKIQFLLCFLLVSLSQKFYSQSNSMYDKNKNVVYYEKVVPFENKNKLALIKEVEKYLAINDMKITYKDENDIYAVDKFATLYTRYIFFLFHHTSHYNMVYDIHFSFKDNKLKYRAENFFMVPKSISVRSFGGWSNGIGSNISSMWSTTQIPTDVPKTPVEIHFRAGKTKKKHRLFQSMDNHIALFEDNFKKMITEKTEW